jgi:hypothetical protein
MTLTRDLSEERRARISGGRAFQTVGTAKALKWSLLLSSGTTKKPVWLEQDKPGEMRERRPSCEDWGR